MLLIPLYASHERMQSQIEANNSLGMDPEAQFDLGVRIAGADPSEISAEERARVRRSRR